MQHIFAWLFLLPWVPYATHKKGSWLSWEILALLLSQRFNSPFGSIHTMIPFKLMFDNKLSWFLNLTQHQLGNILIWVRKQSWCSSIPDNPVSPALYCPKELSSQHPTLTVTLDSFSEILHDSNTEFGLRIFIQNLLPGPPPHKNPLMREPTPKHGNFAQSIINISSPC